MTGSAPEHLGYGIVAFADILGFRSMVEADSSNRPPRFLTRILDALKDLEQELAMHDVEVTLFSDSIVLSTSFSPQDFLACTAAARRLQQLLVARSISVRGGIAFGYHYAESDRLFSQALVKAYDLESRVARFPRMLLDGNLLDAALNHPDMSRESAEQIGTMLMSDRDGQVFVHYLDEALLDAHRDLIRAGVGAASSSASILEKAHWQADYHDFVAARLDRPMLDLEAQARFAPFEPGVGTAPVAGTERATNVGERSAGASA